MIGGTSNWFTDVLNIATSLSMMFCNDVICCAILLDTSSRTPYELSVGIQSALSTTVTSVASASTSLGNGVPNCPLSVVFHEEISALSILSRRSIIDVPI